MTTKTVGHTPEIPAWEKTLLKAAEVSKKARLYAAAPELLEALKAWNRFWDNMPKGQLGKLVLDVGLLNDAFLKTNAAIAKAEPK